MCNNPITHCYDCNEAGLRSEICLSCDQFYYTANGSTCIPCGESVTKCYDCDQLNNGYSINCTVCVPGYFPDTTSHCKLCNESITECASCSPLYNGSATCLICNPKYYTLNGTVCSSCISFDPNCFYCNNFGQCTQCLLEFFVNDTTHRCDPKPPCVV